MDRILDLIEENSLPRNNPRLMREIASQSFSTSLNVLENTVISYEKLPFGKYLQWSRNYTYTSGKR